VLRSAAALAAALLASPVASQQTETVSVPEVAAASWYLMDHTSANVLAESNARERLAAADLVKLMTAYTVFEALDSGRIALEDEVTVSDSAWRVNGPRMFIEPGSRVAVGDLLRGLVVQASNDASVALAEHVAGAEPEFVALMNAHARGLGLRDSHYTDSTGGDLDGQYTSARDTATLARALIARFADYYPLYAEREFTYNDITRHNPNVLLWQDASVDGLAAAQTGGATFSLVGSAERAGARLIAVVLHASDEDARARGALALLEHGFREFETHLLYLAGEPIVSTRVWQGVEEEVAIGLAGDLHATIPKGRYPDLAAELQLHGRLRAPLGAGTEVGELRVLFGGELFATAPVVTLAGVEQGGFFKRLSDRIALWFQ
jgi:serine-type D-Ala-D-Ala carboxypeptidase (penicillin-binding protein 5/6)